VCVCVQVVVAVLLDNFTAAAAEEKARIAQVCCSAVAVQLQCVIALCCSSVL